MNKNRFVAKIVLICLLISSFLLICIGMYLINLLKKEQGEVSTTIEKIIDVETIEDIFEKYDTKLIERIENDFFVVFSKDLFENNGSSNFSYFSKLVNELTEFVEKKDFKLIDEEKGIEIFAKFNIEKGEYDLIINEIEEFYSVVNGESYVKVDNSEIESPSLLGVNNYFLTKLELYDYAFSSIKSDLGEGIDLGNGYYSYFDDAIKVRTVPTGSVKNIIFTKKFEGTITLNTYVGMSLSEIEEKEPNYAYGSVNKGYLGYRNDEYYLFFYDDEVSVYTYSYKKNTTFENFLKEYLETGDLEAFANNLMKKWKAYDYFEYDAETKKLHILYSTRGVEIDIENNDSTGITLYDNYYFTDLTKSYVKSGKISFESDVDLVEQIEIQRRSNN